MPFYKYILIIIILILLAGVSTYVALESDVFSQEESTNTENVVEENTTEQ